MRRLAVLALAGLLLSGCGGEPSEPAGAAPTTSPAAVSPDTVFAQTMDVTAPGWREEFAVDGIEGSESEAVAILAARTACSKLEAMPVEEVLVDFLAGELPADTVGALVYAATVAYCPTFTRAVQDYADANR